MKDIKDDENNEMTNVLDPEINSNLDSLQKLFTKKSVSKAINESLKKE